MALMLFGAVTMTLPVLSIVAKFELYYEKNVLVSVHDREEEEAGVVIVNNEAVQVENKTDRKGGRRMENGSENGDSFPMICYITSL